MEREAYEAASSACARTAAGADTERDLGSHWRSRLIRKLGWVLAFKLAALALIWYLWFAPGDIAPVDAPATGAHFGLARGRPPAVHAVDPRTAVEQENLRD